MATSDNSTEGRPWLDPNASGILSESSVEQIIRTNEALSRMSTLLPDELKHALLTFGASNGLLVQRDIIPERTGGGEGWTIRVYGDRLERWVQLRVPPESTPLGRLLSVRTLAFWSEADTPDRRGRCWETNLVPRCYGLTDRTPAQALTEILVLALSDARSYGIDDLEPLPLRAPGRPVGLPWAWG